MMSNMRCITFFKELLDKMGFKQSLMGKCMPMKQSERI